MDSRGEADTRSPKTTSTTRASEAVRVFFAESRAGPLRGFNRGTEARYFAHQRRPGWKGGAGKAGQRKWGFRPIIRLRWWPRARREFDRM